MAHTNVDTRDRASAKLDRLLLDTERKFWRDHADTLQRELENIAEAVEQYGFVDLYNGKETVTLIAKPALSPTPAPKED